MITQVPDFFTNARQLKRQSGIDTAFVGDDLRLELARGVIELDRDEALPGTVFEVFDHALVAGVVRDNEREVLMRLQDFAALFDGEEPSVVGEGVDEDCGVFACLDDFIEITHRPAAGSSGQRAIDPHRLIPLQ
jgi:hypothetical protein